MQFCAARPYLGWMMMSRRHGAVNMAPYQAQAMPPARAVSNPNRSLVPSAAVWTSALLLAALG